MECMITTFYTLENVAPSPSLPPPAFIWENKVHREMAYKRKKSLHKIGSHE